MAANLAEAGRRQQLKSAEEEFSSIAGIEYSEASESCQFGRPSNRFLRLARERLFILLRVRPPETGGPLRPTAYPLRGLVPLTPPSTVPGISPEVLRKMASAEP